MPKEKRIRRDKIPEEDYSFLLPIDITKFGSEEDPCFGKLHSLTAPECKSCGDSDFCQLAMAQNLNGVRIKAQLDQRFKDVEEAEQILIDKKSKALNSIETHKVKKTPRIKTILAVAKEFNLDKETVKQLYNKI